jgi:hypothetical protein
MTKTKKARAVRSAIAPFAFAFAFHALATTDARADEATEIAAARTIGQDGVMLAEQGRCAQAVEKLAQAEKLHHAPTTALRLAECEIELGHVVAGTERLERLLREPQPFGTPAAFVAAYAKADRVLYAARPRIATLRISVKGPKAGQAAVAVDGDAVPAVLVEGDRPTDPGTHTVTATSRGFLATSAKVSLKDGETSSVTLTLQPDPNAPATDPSAPADPAAPAEGSYVSRNKLAFVALGVGVVGLAVGAVSGALVASKTSSLDGECVDKACPASRQSDIDSASTLATVSTVGFVVGGAGIATGVVLLLLGRPAPSAQTARPHVIPVIGATGLGLDGRF